MRIQQRLFWRTCVLLSVLMSSLSAVNAHAIPYCALRDPVNTIYELFPEANGYRSNVQTVGREARTTVKEQLPFTLHFNELGRHTLYVALKDSKPIGFMHARSEAGEWGLTEYAWAVTPSLKIQGLKIQRSRDPSIRRSNIKNSPIIGLGLAELKQLYNDIQQDNNEILLNMVKSAMKTLVITRAVWADEVEQSLITRLSSMALPSTQRTMPIDNLYDQQVLDNLTALDLEQSPIFNRQQLRGFRIEDAAHKTIGIIVHTSFDLTDPQRALWWIASSDGKIEFVLDHRSEQNDSNFKAVLGYAPEHSRDCATLADLGALEIATLARHHQSG